MQNTRPGLNSPRFTRYSVVLRHGKPLRISDFPAGMIASVTQTDSDRVQILILGSRAAAEKILRRQGDSVRCYELIAADPPRRVGPGSDAVVS